MCAGGSVVSRTSDRGYPSAITASSCSRQPAGTGRPARPNREENTSGRRRTSITWWWLVTTKAPASALHATGASRRAWAMCGYGQAMTSASKGLNDMARVHHAAAHPCEGT